MLRIRWRFRGLGIACLISLFVTSNASAVQSLSDLTGPWQLFVDNSIIAKKSGLTRSYHAFDKYSGNPVLQADQPWEGESTFIAGTVLSTEDHSGYRMWYRTYEDIPSCYATSTDGIHWTKPALGIISFNGSSANNMFTTLARGVSVMHTPFNTNQSRRYTFFGTGSANFVGAWSSDGIHWSGVPNNPLMSPGDTGHAAWDPLQSRYLAYVKMSGYPNGLQCRCVAFSQTTNFTSWPDPYLIMMPDAFDDRWVPPDTIQRTHFYALNAFSYESMYLGLLLIFRATDNEGYYDGPMFVELISSRDGVHWTREEGDRPPTLPLGPAGAWDDGILETATHPLKEGNTLKLYYSGWDESHASAGYGHAKVGLATLRKDGFASLDAGPAEGSVTTRKLPRISAPLHVNYRTSGGWLKVEVLDENSQVITGYSRNNCTALNGDSTDAIVTWTPGQNLPSPPGYMRLRFILQNASIYSFNPGGVIDTVVGPAITLQPLPLTVCPGTVAAFTVQATGTGTLAYQWQKNDLNLTNGGHYSGATTTTLTVSNANSSDAGTYACIVTNSLDSVISPSAYLTVGPIATITQQPSDQSVIEKQAAVFTVTATGLGTLTYLWQKNSVNLANSGHYTGATTATLTVSNADNNDVANYRCVVTGTCGVATSNEATLTVTLLPPPIPGDFDDDRDVDQSDFGYLQACLAGAEVVQPLPDCVAADMNDDGHVDAYDVTLFLQCMSGPNVPGDPNCAD